MPPEVSPAVPSPPTCPVVGDAFVSGETTVQSVALRLLGRTPPGEGGSTSTWTLSESTRTGACLDRYHSLPSGRRSMRCRLVSTDKRPVIQAHYPSLSGGRGTVTVGPSLTLAFTFVVCSRHRGEGSRLSPACAGRRSRRFSPSRPSSTGESALSPCRRCASGQRTTRRRSASSAGRRRPVVARSARCTQSTPSRGG